MCWDLCWEDPALAVCIVIIGCSLSYCVPQLSWLMKIIGGSKDSGCLAHSLFGCHRPLGSDSLKGLSFCSGTNGEF